MNRGALGMDPERLLETIEMSKSYCPFLYGKFRKFFRAAAMAATLSAAACAGSSDQSDEPVAASDVDSAEATASEDSGLIIEQENPDDTGNDAPQVSEDSVNSDNQEVAASEEPPMENDTEAVPEEIMNSEVASAPEAPESLDATLDSEATPADDVALDQAVAAQPVADTVEEPAPSLSVDMNDAPTMANAGNFGQSSGILPPGVMASPGAAIFIKSKYDSPTTTASSSGGGKLSYVVVPGDTISGISRKIFGSFNHSKQIAAWNGIKAPFVIQPGDVIKFDANTAQSKSFSSSGKMAGTNTFKVKHGDTLSKIASQLYGSTGAWKVLYNMNKGKISNPNLITAGMVLSYSKSGAKKMPATAKVKKAAPKKEVEVAAPVVEEVAQPAAVEEAPATTGAVEATETPVAETAEVQEDAAPVAVEEDTDQVIDVNVPVDEDL